MGIIFQLHKGLRKMTSEYRPPSRHCAKSNFSTQRELRERMYATDSTPEEV